jgi:hypothetical protein
MKLFSTVSLPANHPFIQNKYTHWYYTIIEAARQRHEISGYTEKHHVIPDCFYIQNRSKGKRKGWLPGNSNDPSNLVQLTFREHFLCHWLLTKMITGKPYYQMESALASFRMTNSSKKYCLSSEKFCRIREAHRIKTIHLAKARIGQESPKKGKTYGKQHNPSPTRNSPRPWLQGRESPNKGKQGVSKGKPSPKKGRKFGPNSVPSPLKGQTSPRKGKTYGKWWNNGIDEIVAAEQPDGFLPGRLSRKSKSFLQDLS